MDCRTGDERMDMAELEMGQNGHCRPGDGSGWALQTWRWDGMDTGSSGWPSKKGTAPPTTALLPFANNNLQRPRRPKLGRAAQLTPGDIISVQQAALYLVPVNVTCHTWGCTLPPWCVWEADKLCLHTPHFVFVNSPLGSAAFLIQQQRNGWGFQAGEWNRTLQKACSPYFFLPYPGALTPLGSCLARDSFPWSRAVGLSQKHRLCLSRVK